MTATDATANGDDGGGGGGGRRMSPTTMIDVDDNDEDDQEEDEYDYDAPAGSAFAAAGSAAVGYTPLDDPTMANFAYGGGVAVGQNGNHRPRDDGYGEDGDDGENWRIAGGAPFGVGAGGGGQMFTFAPGGGSAWSSDDDDDDEDDDAGGPTPQDRSGAGGDGRNGEGYGGGQDPHDLFALADQALLALDDEYETTLRAGGDGLTAASETVAPAGSDGPACPSDSTADAAGVVVGGSSSDVGGISSSSAPDLDLFSETAMATALAAAERDSRDGGTAGEMEAIPGRDRSLPPVDADAVLRAVGAIRLRAPDLTAALDTGGAQGQRGSREEILPETTTITAAAMIPLAHPIMPRAPLSAFRKGSARAVEATANLTRSATLAEAVVRCLSGRFGETTASSASSPGGEMTLTIHVLGADHVECRTAESIRAAFGPFVRWIGGSSLISVRSLQIVLVGPNVPGSAVSRPPIDLMPSGGIGNAAAGTRGLDSAVALCCQGTYDEFFAAGGCSDVDVDGLHLTPDLCVAFNAGIWGYDSWVPTLEAMLSCRFFNSPIPLVVTAYTVQECEDDAEVIMDVIASFSAKGVGGDGATATGVTTTETTKRLLWGPELNPYGSRKIRETITAPSGRVYKENGAWQAWTFGVMTAVGGEGREVHMPKQVEPS